jgi:hypothetical protein
MPTPLGSFSEEALKLYSDMVSLGWDLDFSEQGNHYDFARCVRADGTYYGTRGKCRKGTEAGAKEEAPKQPRRSRAAETAPASPKADKPAAPAPEKKSDKTPKEAVYTPSEIPAGKRGLRERVKQAAGRAVRKVKSELELKQEERESKKTTEAFAKKLRDKGASEKEIAEKVARWKAEDAESAKQRKASTKESEAIYRGFQKNAPEGVKVTRNKEGIVQFETKTKFGDTVRLGWRPDKQIEFSINGEYGMGQVTDRKAQVATALQVKKLWDAAVKSMPDGTFLNVNAHKGDGDEKTKARSDAYVKMGFSKPEGNEPGETQYAVIKDGKVHPADSKGNRFWIYAEGKTLSSSQQDVRNWFTIIYGV